MIPPRLIPVILIDRYKRAVKTVGFGPRTYLGDPLNIIRLLNEKQVDEVCVLDIDATSDCRSPNCDFVAALASECFMPMSYGGGISNLHQARSLIACGIEKLVLRTNATEALIGSIAHEFGRQAVIACIDYRESGGTRLVEPSREPLAVAVNRVTQAGAGELLLQSIDGDGARCGMDLEGIAETAGNAVVPLIALGGAGGFSHLISAISAGADAAASGSAFFFIGKLRAVLISYPEYQDRLKSSTE